MNPSRNSYTYPNESENVYTAGLILQSCEFCQRTFIPDSLSKHRKICYRNFIKKRSKMGNSKSKRSGHSKSGKITSGGDTPLMRLNEMMVKRQQRRMNWRGRHEEFINMIRYARECAVAMNKGEDPPPPLLTALTTEQKEELEKCKHCLRRFNKEAFAKHIVRCKELSIQSSRARPNKENIEAKRRLSVRLYYKPRSYRDDSPQDTTASISSNDCMSFGSVASAKICNSIRSKSSRRSTLSASVRKLKEESNTKSQTNNAFKKPSRSLSMISAKDKSSARNCKAPPPSSKEKNEAGSVKQPNNADNINNSHRTSLSAKNRLDNSKKVKRSKTLMINNKESECLTIPSRKLKQKDITMAQKLKVISNMLNKKDTLSNACNNKAVENGDTLTQFIPPDPAESLKEAKEVLKYLHNRSLFNEQMKQANNVLNESNEEYLLNKINALQASASESADASMGNQPKNVLINTADCNIEFFDKTPIELLNFATKNDVTDYSKTELTEAKVKPYSHMDKMRQEKLSRMQSVDLESEHHNKKLDTCSMQTVNKVFENLENLENPNVETVIKDNKSTIKTDVYNNHANASFITNFSTSNYHTDPEYAMAWFKTTK